MPKHRDISALDERVRDLSRSGWSLHEPGVVQGLPIHVLGKSAPSAAHDILLVGGIHGDEPAGVEAALCWMETGAADAWPVNWLVIPCANPWGWTRDQREGSTGHDLNRSFNLSTCCGEVDTIRNALDGRHFGFSMDFHEDCDAAGYYLCEIKNRSPFFGETMARAAGEVIPIWDVPRLDGRKASFPGGIRRVIPTATALRRRRLWPLEFHLMHRHTRHTFCSETPTSLPMERRVHAHHAALRTALEMFFNQP